MAVVENTRDAAKGGAAGAAGGITAQASGAVDGLANAAANAGDVLKGIFGGLPWNMDPSAIVDAVSPVVVSLAEYGVVLAGVVG